MAAPPLDSPCDGLVTYLADTKILVKSSKGRSGPTLNMTTRKTLVLDVIEACNQSRDYVTGIKTNYLNKSLR